MPIYYEQPPIEGSTVPEGYEYRVNGDKLELWNTSVAPEELLMTHTLDLTTVSGSLQTSLNTLFLEQAHSISSAGEDVVFKNLQSGYLFNPIWCPSDEEGVNAPDPVYFKFSSTVTDYYPNGNTPAMTAVAGQYAAVFPFNAVIFSFAYAVGEAYTGQLTLEAKNLFGGTIYRKKIPSATYAIGDIAQFPRTFTRLFAGESLVIRILKEDNTTILLKAGDDLDEPWRVTATREFVSREVIYADEAGLLPTDRLPAVGSVEVGTVNTLNDLYALPVSPKFRMYVVLSEDRMYYLNPNLDPSVPSNWIAGPSTVAAVASFNNRTGAVMPLTGDYTASMVGAVARPLTNDGVRRVMYGQNLMAEPLGTTLTESSTSVPATTALTNQLYLGKHPKIVDYVKANAYVTGAQVFLYGNLYEANGNIPANTQFALGTTGATWKMVVGTPVSTIIDWDGDRLGLSVPTGYWPCDGTTITGTDSAINGMTTLDTRNKVLANASVAHPVGSSVGSETNTLSRSNLPNESVGGGSINYTPQGSVTVATGGAHFHTLNARSAVGSSPNRFRIESGAPITQATGTDGAHSHSATFEGTAAVLTVPSFNLNDNVTQQAVNNLQPTAYVTQLIKL